MEMGKRICVLEDNKDIREIIELVLHDEKYEVFAFGSIGEFNRAVPKLLPDAFLLDVMLPDGNGFDVCCGLKGNKVTHDIPVLMMSANFTAGQMNKECKAEDFISKPFDIFELVKRISAQVS